MNRPDSTGAVPETELSQRILNEFQRNFPLTSAPYAAIAERLGTSEAVVIDTLRSLQEAGVVSRVGPVLRPRHIGASTLAAMSVPAQRLSAVAELVNRYAEVNHNYEREHRYNLWFVLTAHDESRIAEVLAEIEQCTGLPVLNLPMLAEYRIDLGFPLQWVSP